MWEAVIHGIRITQAPCTPRSWSALLSLVRKIGKSFLLFPLLLSATAAAEKSAPIIDDPAYTHAARLVEVEPARRLNLYCLGKGSPTVVFDSGITDETDVWALVQPVIASHTRACSYDRAGSGYSDPGRRAGTSANIVDDLHRLLVAASIKPPYILVGHSYGGMNVRLYADLYPAEVVGMVLVDSTSEDWVQSAWKLDMLQRTYEQYHAQLEPFWQELRECVKAASAGFTEGTDLYKQCVPAPDPRFSDAINAAYLKAHMSLGYQQANLTENINIHDASADQVRAARRWYGDMPLTALTASPNMKLWSNETQAHKDAVNRMIAGMHDQMAALSKRGVVRPVPDSEHNIQMTKPDAVNDAILEVLKEAAQKK
ncbi:MAG: alpha/beta hydrolase [Lysobacteraceae bacterium]